MKKNPARRYRKSMGIAATLDVKDRRALHKKLADVNLRRKQSAIPQARRLLQSFSGGAAVKQETIDKPRSFDVGLRIGSIIAIAYDVGNGDKRIHRFSKSSAPTLIVSSDGKQLAIVGGKYRFTNRGIVDTK
jgi:hypothetical protein